MQRRATWSNLLIGTILAGWHLSAGPAGAGAPSELAVRLQPLISAHAGTVAVAIKHLPSGTSFLANADKPQPTASLIKVAVMVEAYRQADAGKLDLDQMLTLAEADKVPGSGILTRHISAGAQISLRDAIRLMIAYSDNTATNLVLARVGLRAVDDDMEQLGFPNTKIHAPVFHGELSEFPDRSRQFGLGSTTAQEMLTLLERLERGELAGADSTAAMIEHLRACESRATLPRFLPREIVIGHKTGSVNAVRTAAGIIETSSGPLVVVVLTSENEDQRWTEENTAEILCARIAQQAVEVFNPHSKTTSTTMAPLALGSEGWLVEGLQRTLNARLQPPPGLAADGEFGNLTEAAVRAFQSSQNLPATGIVDSSTWERLGPLVSETDSHVDWTTFELDVPEKQPSDALAGPPFVTCKGWCAGDGQTGEVIGGEQLDETLDMASTTKLMTAWLVLRLSEADPDVLNEVVEISARAAETPGSSAGLREGERLPVRELLYGLLLPSGNDAALALAEHFGGRFDPSASQSDATDAAACFVAEMNRAAAAMNLDKTEYCNPHGLTAVGHHTSPRDLLRLAAMLVRDGRILPFVNTRHHLGRLDGPTGYVRFEPWVNTNRLLNTEGYLGMKTGTTDAAGACLVSLAERDGERLIVVVLGSTSADGRYVDTRNLFRWAWAEKHARAGDRQ